ncbi:MAG: diguanylate cyclase (GGDEF)-like protein [Glaciecola sp.]|jgi:diguanylate cyclase (GGDEF)-like protein
MPRLVTAFSKQRLFRYCFLIYLAIFCNITFSVHASEQSIPTINVSQKYQTGEVKLDGEWGFYWGEWLPLDEIDSNKYLIQTIPKLDFLTNIVKDDEGNSPPFVYGYGTYLLKIDGLRGAFQQPAIHMRSVSDAWQAWWVNVDGSNRYLGESGKISRDGNNQQHRYRTTILDLPADSSAGTLVIYLSSHTSSRAGLFAVPAIQEHEQVSRSIYIDLAIRILLIGVGLFVVMQNLIFYVQRPKEKTLILLVIFGLSGLMRGLVSSDYFYVFVGDPSHFSTISRLEYLLIIWPAIAGLHFFANLCPFKGDKQFVQFNYSILILTIMATWLLPMHTIMLYLFVYQAVLLFIATSVLVIVANGIIKRMPGSQSLMMSLLPLILAMCNDIYATYASQYNLFVTEYALFLFFFMQSQIHASHYLSALETAEHLSNHLQQEIGLKTEELSVRNQMLETRTVYLEQQRNKIKELSQIDHLTGLFNRQTLDEYSKTQFKHSQDNQLPLSVIMMDIDNFKSVNDQFGHGVGDDCLKFVAVYLATSGLRKVDIIARYGGEEILILLPNTDLVAAEIITRRICAGLSSESVVGDHTPITLTASFGVAERRTSDVNRIEYLIDEADKALYRAKVNGKNRVEVADKPR